MARDNKNMHTAKNVKNDEFYTRYEDIQKEMNFYTNHFKDKVVYCNCDDARESNFFKYFSDFFGVLGLKKLITTSYNANGNGTILIYEGDKNGNGFADDDEIIIKELSGNGDFRSEECLQILQESDIIVTNPPFSLFREYVDVLFAFNKKFIIIGNNNAITYKEFFPHIKNGEVWLGRTLFTGQMPYFIVPSDFEITNDRVIEENGKRMKQVNGVCWFTNLDNNKDEEIISLFNEYNSTDYPTYDNYNAINVNFIKDMPYDYDGVIGVPITALKYLCSDGLLHFDTPMREREKSIQDCWCDDYYKSDRGQFWLSIHQGKEDICKSTHSIYKIVDCNDCRKENMNKKNTMLVKDKDSAINGKPIYARILIQRIN